MSEPTSETGWTPPVLLDAAAGWSWRLLAIALGAAALFAAMSLLGVVVVPMVLGLFLTAVLSPLHTALRARRCKPALAAAICLLVLAGGLGLVAWLFVSALIEPWTEISARLSHGLDVLEAKIGDAGGQQSSDAASSVRSSGGGGVSALLNGALTVVSGVTMLVSTILLSLFVTFFYVKDGPLLWGAVIRQGGDRAANLDRIGHVMWDKLRGFVKGTAMVATVDAVGIGLGAWFLGVPSPGAIFALTFVFAFIPYFGAMIGGFVACVLAVSSGGLDLGVAMLIVILLVQQLEGNVLQPLLVGNAVDLHPLVIALGAIAGGAVAGVLGMFLAIPVIAAGSAAVKEVRVIRAEAAAAADGTGLKPDDPGPAVAPAQ